MGLILARGREARGPVLEGAARSSIVRRLPTPAEVGNRILSQPTPRQADKITTTLFCDPRGLAASPASCLRLLSFNPNRNAGRRNRAVADDEYCVRRCR